MKMTTHAVRRTQQRGVTKEALRLLLRFGDYKYERGADVYRASLQACKEMVEEGVNPQIVDKLKNVYAVLIDEVVITVAHKH